MTLQEGTSSLDTVSFKLADVGIEIPNWISYSYDQDFLKPTCEWSFTIDYEDAGDLIGFFVYGQPVNLYINNLIQCAGIIEKVSIDTGASSGTVIRVQGRDIMARVIDSFIDPKTSFPTNSLLSQIVQTVLQPLGIGPGTACPNIDNSDSLNLNVLTGKTYPPDEDQQFNKKALKELKGKYGEGCWEFLEKALKRQGFMMWARADGQGVVVSQPNWTNNSGMVLIHVQNGTMNNVITGQKVVDGTGQPTMIYCKGTSNGIDSQSTSSDIIMINELIGLDADGNVLPQVINEIAKYYQQGVLILPLREVLIPLRQSFAQQPVVRGACYLKDKEAQDSTQVQNFVKRAMAHFQEKMYRLEYTVPGHTQGGTPWAVNTLVNIYDQILDVGTINDPEQYWVIRRHFSKEPGSGTMTKLELIKPYTLDISIDGSKGPIRKVPYTAPADNS